MISKRRERYLLRSQRRPRPALQASLACIWVCCLCTSRVTLAFSTSILPTPRASSASLSRSHRWIIDPHIQSNKPPAQTLLPLFLQEQDSDTTNACPSRWKQLWRQFESCIRSGWKWGKRKFAIALFCLLMIFGGSEAAFAKGTMGRSGGSFKSAPRPSPPSSSRVYSSPRSYYHPSPPRVIMRPPSTSLYYRNPPGPTIVVGQPFGPAVRRGFRPSDLLLVTGSGLAIAYGVSTRLERDRREQSGILGPGYSVAKLTVSLNVPNRDAPNSILAKLQQLSSDAPTSTRKGVQDLVSAVALELLRQESSIRSAASFSEHFKQEGEAERTYFRQSIQERSKFEDEREYSGHQEALPPAAKKEEESQATEAVVTILIAIEGDSTQLPTITSREDVLQALNRLAVDAQMGECLLSGEVSWAPELRSESLSVDDIYVDYPTLYPI